MIAIDLSKQQALYADPRAIRHINVTGNLDHAGNTIIFFIYEEPKETFFGIFTRNYKSFVNLLYNNLVWFINIK